MSVLEYCSHEYFEPTCGEGEMILIQNAQYGRMKVGRCVEHDLGYIGCTANAQEYIDETCLGHRSCSVSVALLAVKTSKGCIKGLDKYLEASYMCVPGKFYRSIACLLCFQIYHISLRLIK